MTAFNNKTGAIASSIKKYAQLGPKVQPKPRPIIAAPRKSGKSVMILDELGGTNEMLSGFIKQPDGLYFNSQKNEVVKYDPKTGRATLVAQVSFHQARVFMENYLQGVYLNAQHIGKASRKHRRMNKKGR